MLSNLRRYCSDTPPKSKRFAERANGGEYENN
jgi:hypothetical protein